MTSLEVYISSPADSTVISQYPNNPEYPQFYCLGTVLRKMVDSSLKIHPYTKEMLATLDQ